MFSNYGWIDYNSVFRGIVYVYECDLLIIYVGDFVGSLGCANGWGAHVVYGFWFDYLYWLY